MLTLNATTRHEHLYERLQKFVIRTDKQPKPTALKKVLQGAQVILCTLDTISNPRLREIGLTENIPVNSVVIDEASQIEIGQYLPLFELFGQTLRKLSFIGDDKQREYFFPLPFLILYFFSVPPHGHDTLKNLQSVFELTHLRASSIFLDIQCENRSSAFEVYLRIYSYSRTRRPYAPSNWRGYISTSL